MPTNIIDGYIGGDSGFNFSAPAVPFPIQNPFTLEAPDGLCQYALLPDYPQFNWTGSDRTATEVYMMPAMQVNSFVQKAIGLQLPFEGAPFFLRNKRRLPGNPDLIATRISARPMEPRPGDPCLTDEVMLRDLQALREPPLGDGQTVLHSRYNQTYSRLTQVTIEYSSEVTEPGIGDLQFHPGTSYSVTPILRHEIERYTETKLTVGGEFMTLGQQNTYFMPATGTNSSGYTSIDHNPAGSIYEWRWNPANYRYVPIGDLTTLLRNQSYEIAHAMVIPTRERTVIWRHVWRVPHGAILDLLGCVNGAYPGGGVLDRGLAFLDYAPPETVLFSGATITREALNAPDGRPLYTIEYKFVEKQVRITVDANGNVTSDPAAVLGVIPNTPTATTSTLRILGWNHYWRSAANEGRGGWERLIVDKVLGTSPYRHNDFRHLFDVLVQPEPIVRYSLQGNDFAIRAIRPDNNRERGSPVEFTPSP